MVYKRQIKSFFINNGDEDINKFLKEIPEEDSVEIHCTCDYVIIEYMSEVN